MFAVRYCRCWTLWRMFTAKPPASYIISMQKPPISVWRSEASQRASETINLPCRQAVVCQLALNKAANDREDDKLRKIIFRKKRLCCGFMNTQQQPSYLKQLSCLYLSNDNCFFYIKKNNDKVYICGISNISDWSSRTATTVTFQQPWNLFFLTGWMTERTALSC